jgi:hypothetical protein
MRIVGKFKWVLDQAELEKANDRDAKRALFYFFDDDGFFHVKGRLSPEDGAVVKSALEAAADAIRQESAGCEGDAACDGYDATIADALVRVANDSLAARGGAAAPYRAVVHVDAATLMDGSGERSEIDGGPPIASETARRLCCDALIETVLERDGEILDVGRSRRSPPPRLRRALELRDRTCVWPGCTTRAHLQSRHIVHWIHNGRTEPSNLSLLCWRHHRLVHERRFAMTVDADGTRRFYRPDGTEIGLRAPPRGDGTRLVAANAAAGKSITAETCKSGWDGTMIDTTYVADMLCLEAYHAAQRRAPPAN